MGFKTLVIFVITLICVCQTLAGKYDLSDDILGKPSNIRSRRGSPGMPGNAMPGLPGPRAPTPLSADVPVSVGVPVRAPVVTSNNIDDDTPALVKDKDGQTWLVVLISKQLADSDE